MRKPLLLISNKEIYIKTSIFINMMAEFLFLSGPPYHTQGEGKRLFLLLGIQVGTIFYVG